MKLYKKSSTGILPNLNPIIWSTLYHTGGESVMNPVNIPFTIIKGIKDIIKYVLKK